jgi:ATPase subunit of ABC transporter with duplicated ATPase domains
MVHKPIQLKNVSLSFPHKLCFENFTVQIPYGSHIALIGRNGTGKSSLLNMLNGIIQPTSGEINTPDDVRIGYVPQLFTESISLSGGQRFNEALTKALSLDPNVLLLDEPTNNLDVGNRASLMRMLRSFPGTLIIVSHDVELLRTCIDTLWHIDNGHVHVFSGNYDDYIRERDIKRSSIEQELSRLDRQKKDTHHALMKEQTRAAKSRAKGEKSIEQRKWPKAAAKLKAIGAEHAAGSKKAEISQKKEALSEALANLRLPEIILPTFSLNAADIGNKTLISISEASVGYQKEKPILHNISFSVTAGERIAIMGDNGSGKSTFIKGILHDPMIITAGSWHVPKLSDIGYLDQHYGTLSPKKSVLETIADLVPTWSHAEIRRHLNDFLFRKNAEVNALVATLSGGEKVRLTLAQIAAKTPQLLILDEITNNLDLETREHVIQVLKEYPGSMIVISHDEDFLHAIDIQSWYEVKNGTVLPKV